MARLENPRERYKYINSLACLLKACEGKKTVVELRDNTSVSGTVVQVDAFLNIAMTSVVYKRPQRDPLVFEEFYLRGSKLRHVQIPNEIDIREAISQQLRYYSSVRRTLHSGNVADAGRGRGRGTASGRGDFGGKQ